MSPLVRIKEQKLRHIKEEESLLSGYERKPEPLNSPCFPCCANDVPAARVLLCQETIMSMFMQNDVPCCRHKVPTELMLICRSAVMASDQNVLTFE